MRTVGISNKTRHWQHYCFSNPPDGYRYSRMVDVPWHVMRVSNQFLIHTKFFFPLKRADLYHTYNGVVANRRPWVVEVESWLPRYSPMREDHALFRWGQRRLASRDCRALIFTSEHAASMNREKLTACDVDPAKMHVVYRAVEQFSPFEKAGEPFTILFVGNAFYRKGGVELLKAFQRLARSDARLWIVSTLEVDWGVPPPDETTIEWVRQTIEDDPRITLRTNLPHAGVIELMRRAHVFVQTTFNDAFNNGVQEAMAAQLPVISSDVRALPEIVDHGRNGWLLPVTNVASDDIADAIVSRLRVLMDDSELLARMGRESAAVVSEKFDMRARNGRLAAIYDAALA